ncbi:hypothetical protein NLM59_01870 [Weeksellaceae bacterium KMM 9724]|uniref:hypothetical protein n=1 Tax=Profundicola chukchiensis TaxID=2961959 RepID=UPI0024407FBC|nr:hypothetical protein [Profundicola chukchiensis]MDG4949659.1 hypothetical protein [Profundicola chukchiensis]
MHKIILLHLTLLFTLSFTQGQQTIFSDEVEGVKYLFFDICPSDVEGKTTVTQNKEKSSYNNEEFVQYLIDQIIIKDFIPHLNSLEECIELTLDIVNSKYQSLNELDTNCIENFEVGNFHYTQPNFLDIEVIRTKNKQIEKSSIIKHIYQIDWVSPCNYLLTTLEVSDPKEKHLIGNTIDIKIIDILDNGNYVWFTVLSNGAIIYGEMEKVNDHL